MNKEEHPQDIIQRIKAQVMFIGRMLLAWDTDSIEIGDDEKTEIYYMMDHIYEEMEQLEKHLC